jgi:uncharacterized membrane protein YhaH (DUF805 family)
MTSPSDAPTACPPSAILGQQAPTLNQRSAPPANPWVYGDLALIVMIIVIIIIILITIIIILIIISIILIIIIIIIIIITGSTRTRRHGRSERPVG